MRVEGRKTEMETIIQMTPMKQNKTLRGRVCQNMAYRQKEYERL